MKKLFFLSFIVLIFTGCNDKTFEDVVFRTTADPFYDIPEINSLSLEHTVFLSWNKDDASDLFRLMRAEDQTILKFENIYEGSETTFTDSNLPENKKYIYRLDKKRGQRYFEGEKFAYGWSSNCREDICEPNNLETNATLLEYDLICNLPCVGFITNQKEILDEDWFCVVVPPMRQADIVVGQQNLKDSAAGSQTNLRIQQAGLDSQPVKQQVAFPIKNTTYETKKYYFKIFPERTLLSSEDNFCTVIEYTVSLNQIVKYKL